MLATMLCRPPFYFEGSSLKGRKIFQLRSKPTEKIQFLLELSSKIEKKMISLSSKEVTTPKMMRMNILIEQWTFERQ